MARVLGAGLGIGLGGLLLAAAALANEERVGDDGGRRPVAGSERGGYRRLLQAAAAAGTLAPNEHPQLRRLRHIARQLILHGSELQPRARWWTWEVQLIESEQINSLATSRGKIVFFSGLLDRLQLSDDEVAVVMGHEMAHALLEHGRLDRIEPELLSGPGRGPLGDSLPMLIGSDVRPASSKSRRQLEHEADRVGMALAAYAGFDPRAAMTLWHKMAEVEGLSWPSDHPSSASRMADLEAHLPWALLLYGLAPHAEPAVPEVALLLEP